MAHSCHGLAQVFWYSGWSALAHRLTSAEPMSQSPSCMEGEGERKEEDTAHRQQSMMVVMCHVLYVWVR